MEKRTVSQQRRDQSKVYSLHAPETSCIAKEEEHKQYELGSKVSIASVSGSHVVVGGSFIFQTTCIIVKHWPLLWIQ
jgi:hypothetical protein